VEELEARLEAIEARNRRVEQEKAWETSWTRRIAVGVLTYAVIVVYLLLLGEDEAWLKAIVPTVGFLLSTLVVRKVRDIWSRSL
jgi:hypothetical protein